MTTYTDSQLADACDKLIVCSSYHRLEDQRGLLSAIAARLRGLGEQPADDPDALTEEQACRLHYRGNSIRYAYDKLKNYQGALDDCFAVLRKAGIKIDGKTHLREYIKRLLGEQPAVPREPTIDDDMTPPEKLASHLIDVWCADHGRKIPWDKAVKISAIVTHMADAERDRLLAFGDDDAATDQPAVPNILWGVVANARINARPEAKAAPLWSLVSRATGLGSTSSANLCRQFGANPDSTSSDEDKHDAATDQPAAKERDK